MTKTNNKSVNKAIDDVRKAVLEIDEKKNTKPRLKKFKKKSDEFLLLTEIYDSNNIASNIEKVSIFKINAKKLIQKDIEEWLENNFLFIAQNYARDAIKSLNNKNY